MKREEELEELEEEEEEPGVIGVRGNPIPPAKELILFGSDEELEADVPTRAELRSHQAIQSPTETNWKKGEFRHHERSRIQDWCFSMVNVACNV